MLSTGCLTVWLKNSAVSEDCLGNRPRRFMITPLAGMINAVSPSH